MSSREWDGGISGFSFWQLGVQSPNAKRSRSLNKVPTHSFERSTLASQREPSHDRLAWNSGSSSIHHAHNFRTHNQQKAQSYYYSRTETLTKLLRFTMNKMPKAVYSDTVFLVCVDSRGKSPSDMECYKEHTCSREFFETHIEDNPHTICTKSQVAGLCGLNLKLYFHAHSPYHHAKKEDYKEFKPMCTNVNGIATRLTFNPETGYYNHLVLGKAYVMLNDGAIPLSKEQVWGMEQLITQAKTLYHKDHHHITEDAHQELLTWAEQYKAGTWAPHTIYEPRHPEKPVYYRFESGMSDQATCHHGGTHVHHDGHHKCCHRDENELVEAWETTAWDERQDELLEVRDSDQPRHHLVVKGTAHTHTIPVSRNHTPARHDQRTCTLPSIFTSCSS